MVVEGDAKRMVVRKELRAGQFTAKPMVVDEDVNISGARRALKAEQTSVLHMEVVVVAAMKDVPELLGGNLDYASSMEAARDARRRAARRVQKVTLACASPMEEVGAANIQNA